MNVCWFNKSVDNCNVCEKCARAYMCLMAIGENPKDYGFDVNDETCFKLKRTPRGFVTLPLIVDLVFSFFFSMESNSFLRDSINLSSFFNLLFK